MPGESTSAFAVYSGKTGKLSKKQRYRRRKKEQQKNATSVEKSNELSVATTKTVKKRKHNDDTVKEMHAKKKKKLQTKTKVEIDNLTTDTNGKIKNNKANKTKLKPILKNKPLNIEKRIPKSSLEKRILKTAKILMNQKEPKMVNFMPLDEQNLTEDELKLILGDKFPIFKEKRLNKVQPKKNKGMEEDVRDENDEGEEEFEESVNEDVIEENGELEEEEKLEESMDEPTTSMSYFDNDSVNYQSIEKCNYKGKRSSKNFLKEYSFPEQEKRINIDGLIDSSDLGKEEFRKLIAPVDINEFFRQYWEKEPIYIPSESNNRFSHLISTKLIDKFLREKVVMFGKHLDVTSYKDDIRETHNLAGRARPHVVWDFYNNKCSVRLLCPQAACKNIFLLNSKLQEYFGCFVGANAYLTPPNSQGFAPHYDDIEAFVLQIEGSKKWKIYKPRNKNETLPRYSSKNFNSSDLDLNKPFMEVTLTPGDILYFPRGYIHQAHASKSHSLHITISVYQKNAWIDLLEKALPLALSKAAEEDIEFRRGLPLDYLKQAGLAYNQSKMRKTLIKSVKEKIMKLTKYLDIDRAVDMMGAQFVKDSLPPLLNEDEESRCVVNNGLWMGSNGKLKGNIELTKNTRVRLLRASCQRLVKENVTSENETEEEEIRLYYSLDNSCEYHGEEPQFLVIPEKYVASIQLLVANYPAFTALNSLPLESLEDQASLVGDLWDYGILMTDEPLEENDDTEDDEENDSDENNDDEQDDSEQSLDSSNREDKVVNRKSAVKKRKLDNKDDHSLKDYEKAINDNNKFIVGTDEVSTSEDDNDSNFSASTSSDSIVLSEEEESLDNTFLESDLEDDD